MKNNYNTNYIGPLDGLRIIALIGVFTYHLFSAIVPSGYFGVAIFFVLAGFLSMQSIVLRQDRNVSLNTVKNKIINKFFKLLPALLIVTISVTAVLIIFFRDFLKSYFIEAISSIFFFNNIAQIANNESYFDAMYSLKPFTHLWALSLEMQFYIVFFLTIFTTYRYEKRKVFAYLFGGIYVVSLVLSIYLICTGSSLTRVYYGFDTRLNAFVIGMLASIFTTYFDSLYLDKKYLRFFEISILILLIIFMFARLDSDLHIVIMLIVYSLLCALFILLLCYERSTGTYKTNLYKIFSDKRLKNLVDRSYTIYLTHYPIIVFSNRVFAHVKVNYYIYSILIIVFVALISEIIYKISLFFTKNNNSKIYTIILLCATILFVFLCRQYINFKNELEISLEKEETSEELLIEENIVDSETVNIEDPYTIERVYKFIDRVNKEIGEKAKLTHEDFKKYFNMKITLIGDSVSECSRHALELYFPTSYIDANSNRQWEKGYTVFEDLKARKGGVGDIVVVALGTNSDKDINVEDIERVYYASEGRPFILLTVIIPNLQEEKKRNDVLKKFAATHQNCYIADWYSIMKTHNECFMGDNTHPKGTGSLAFAQIIYNTCIDAINNKKDIAEPINPDFSYISEKKVGDTVKFGKYKIKTNLGREPIEWIVLEKNEEIHSMLLLSKYALDRQIYYKPYVTTGWFRATLRKWLNNEFYNLAFDDEEKNFIREKVISNDKNPIYETWITEDTKDRVFVLSYNELNKYVSKDLLKCKASRYAKDLGVYTENSYCDWWLRTPGDKNSNVMYVSSDGEINFRGDFCTTDDFGVRPAIYIRYE